MSRTLPKAEESFYKQQKLIMEEIGQNLVQWGIKATRYKHLKGLQDEYEAAYENCLDRAMMTRHMVNLRNIARKKYGPELAKEVLILKATANQADLDRMNIATARSHGRISGEIDTFPVLDIDTSLLRYLKFLFREKGQKLHGKPKNVQGMELVGGIFDVTPTEIEQLTRSWFSTSSPLVIGFKESEQGKVFHFCVRWETKAGKKGPWSPIMKVVIP
jgi:hypothetical protein